MVREKALCMEQGQLEPRVAARISQPVVKCGLDWVEEDQPDVLKTQA